MGGTGPFAPLDASYHVRHVLSCPVCATHVTLRDDILRSIELNPINVKHEYVRTISNTT